MTGHRGGESVGVGIARLVPWRCPSCGGLLARMRLSPGSVVEIKCARCGVLAAKEAAIPQAW